MDAEHAPPAAKVHPASRELLPDDPLELQACELPGDTDLMLRLLVEEYARMGWGLEAIMGLARDPNYQVFHGLLRTYGQDRLRSRVAEVLSRCGVFRVRQRESVPLSQQLVQIETKG